MSAAGRKMGLSTPAVSQIVHRLERDVGVVLFERNAQGLRLTPAGNVLKDHARDLIDAEIGIMNELKAYRTQLLPRLRIYIGETIAKYVLPAIVLELTEKVGQTEVEVRAGRSTSYTEDFLRGKFDALISSESLHGDTKLDRFKICQEDLIALVPASVPEERRTLHMLAQDLPFIRLGQGSRMDQFIEGYVSSQGLNPPRGIECSSAAPILELVSSGIGWTITTPMSIAYFRPDPERVANLPLPGPVPSRTIYLLTNSGKLLDVPAAIAASARAAIREHAATWPAHLAAAVRVTGFPTEH